MIARAKAQSATAFLRVSFAPLRLCEEAFFFTAARLFRKELIMIKTLMMLILSLFLVQQAFSQASSAPTESIADPLVRVLITKGVLTEAEGRSIGAGGNPIEQRDRLATLLRDKGLLTGAEYEAVRTVVPPAALARVSLPA